MRRPGSGIASRMSLDWPNLTLVSGGCFRPGTGSTVRGLGAIYMYKIIKNVYKIRFRRDQLATYGQREKDFLLS